MSQPTGTCVLLLCVLLLGTTGQRDGVMVVAAVVMERKEFNGRVTVHYTPCPPRPNGQQTQDQHTTHTQHTPDCWAEW